MIKDNKSIEHDKKDITNLKEENMHKKDDTRQEDTTNENKDNLLIGALFELKPDEDCMCCGRSKEEIEPFEAGNPLVEKYNGALLFKTYRTFRKWYVEELEKALQEAKKNGIDSDQGFEKWLIDKYGKEKGENLMSIFYEATEIDSFWVCKDCFILDDDEFFKVLDKRSSQEEKEMQETINPKQEDMGESINVMEENMEETIKTEDMEIEKQKEVELNEIRSIMARLCELVNDRDLAIVRYHNYTSHLFDLEKAIKDKKNKGEVIDLLKEKQIYLRKTIKEIEKLLDIFRREISDSKKLLVRIRQDYKKVVKKKIISLEKGIKRYEFLLNGFNRIIRKTPDQIMINKEDITNDK